MGGFGTVYEAKPLPPRGEINFGVQATVAISARVVSARQVARQVARQGLRGGLVSARPAAVSQNRSYGLVGTDTHRREPSVLLVAADPRSAQGPNQRRVGGIRLAEARSDSYQSVDAVMGLP